MALPLRFLGCHSRYDHLVAGACNLASAAVGVGRQARGRILVPGGLEWRC